MIEIADTITKVYEDWEITVNDEGGWIRSLDGLRGATIHYATTTGNVVFDWNGRERDEPISEDVLEFAEEVQTKFGNFHYAVDGREVEYDEAGDPYYIDEQEAEAEARDAA